MIVPFFHGSAWSDPYVRDTEWSGGSHPFFQGLYGADDFWQQLLIKILRVVYLTTLISAVHPLKQCIYFRYRKNCNHPFFEVNVPLLLAVPLFDALCHSLSFVVTRCTPLLVTRSHSLSFVVTRYSLSFVVTRCTTHCLSLHHSLSFVVTRCTTCCHSLLLVVTRCTSRLSFYKRSKQNAFKQKENGFKQRKDFRNSSMRLLLPCAIVCYDAPIVLIRYYSKGHRHKHKKWGWKRNDMNRGVFKIQSNIYDGTFLRKSEAATRSRSIQKGVLKNFTKFPGKHLCKSLFFNKTVGLRPATLLKKRLWHRCFPANFVASFFHRTPPGNCFLKLHYRYSARF